MASSGSDLGFEAELFKAADKLRGNLEPSEYKHVALGLIFLKYISEAFAIHRAKLLQEEFADPEDAEEYLAANVFWVPPEARWEHLQANAKRPKIAFTDVNTGKEREGDIGSLIDNAMDSIERANAAVLKDVLPNQAGLFTITPSGRENLDSAILNELAENEVINPDDPMDVARYIAKIHVPNEGRVECLNTLRKMNIHHANLFPDPGGASKYCNDWLSRLIGEERRDAAEAQALEEAADRALDEPAPISMAGEVVSAEAIAKLLRNTVRNDSEFPLELKKLLNGEIVSRSKTNLVESRAFSNRLEDAVARYHAGAISAVEMIQELIGLAKDMQAARARGEEQGLKRVGTLLFCALYVRLHPRAGPS